VGPDGYPANGFCCQDLGLLGLALLPDSMLMGPAEAEPIKVGPCC